MKYIIQCKNYKKSRHTVYIFSINIKAQYHSSSYDIKEAQKLI